VKMIEIADGLAVMPSAVAVLKRADKGCALYTAGQSAAYDGFFVDRDFEDLLDEINDALEDEDGV
jgi:hypothetical protein